MKIVTAESREELLEKLLDTEKLKYCYECGICTASCPVVELVPNHYHPRSLLQKIPLNLERVMSEDGLWLCAWCYRCYKRCPQKLKLPEIFVAVKDLAMEKGHLKGFTEALELIEKEIPLPAVCCYACFHHERGNVEKPLVTRAIKRFVADYGLKGGERKKSRTSKVRGEKVAIIGSGPAGLTAAHELVKKGYQVTVFESLPLLGGMLRVGLPEHRLPKAVLDSEIGHMKKLGVEIKTNVVVGKDVTINKLLKDGYRAVFVATGAHQSRKLHAEGEELNGVIHALDLLKKINMGETVETGNKVAVIGGGNVAMDAARTALRLGAKEVNIIYRRTREEMPANPWEVQEAENEGVKIQFLVAPRKILGKNGRVTSLECIKMTLGELDETGRRRPVPVEGSEFTMEVDTVLLAVGETPDLSLLPKEVEVTDMNTIAVDPFTLETSLAGVFAGGDAVLGPATVIEAILAGKRAAAYIDRYLRGENPRAEEKIESVVKM